MCIDVEIVMQLSCEEVEEARNGIYRVGEGGELCSDVLIFFIKMGMCWYG